MALTGGDFVNYFFYVLLGLGALWAVAVVVLNARRSLMSTSLPGKPAQPSGQRGGRAARIRSYTWICVNDSQSCQACKDRHGEEWRRKNQIPVHPPLAGCTSSEGCRCAIMPVYDDEGVVMLE
jgi:hypothetical protein